MGERISFESEPPQEMKETVEKKKERLGPVFAESMEVFRNPDRPLADGALTVTRDNEGRAETFGGLVILEVLDDAVEMGRIEDDGEIGPSAFMSWEEIVDAAKG